MNLIYNIFIFIGLDFPAVCLTRVMCDITDPIPSQIQGGIVDTDPTPIQKLFYCYFIYFPNDYRTSDDLVLLFNNAELSQ